MASSRRKGFFPSTRKKKARSKDLKGTVNDAHIHSGHFRESAVHEDRGCPLVEPRRKNNNGGGGKGGKEAVGSYVHQEHFQPPRRD